MKKSLIHRPFILIVYAFTIGIILEDCMQCPLRYSLVGVGLFSLMSCIFYRRPWAATIFLLMAICSCGMFYMKSHNVLAKNHVGHIAKYYPRKTVSIEGVIVTDVEERASFKGKKTTFTLEVKRFKTKWGWKKKSGKILVNVFKQANLSYGDLILIEGRLHRPFEFSKGSNFSYRALLKRKGIFHIFVKF